MRQVNLTLEAIDTDKNIRILNEKIKRDEGYYKSLSLDTRNRIRR